MKRNWSIVVIHENSAGREQATRACDHLVKRFWPEKEIEVNWWSCDNLSQPGAATAALARAVKADVMMFAFRSENELPRVAQEWIELWLAKRGEREGVLVDLASRGEESIESGTHRHLYLRQAAHRGGMDYLTREPQSISWAIPDSQEAVTARAQQITTVLNEILRTQPPPTAPQVTIARATL